MFRKFRLVILWQFLVFTGGTAIKSFIQRTFSQDEIASADPTDRPAMAAMSKGFSDLEAIGVFNSSKYVIADILIDNSWSRLSNEDKIKYLAQYEFYKRYEIYTQEAVSFGTEHVRFLEKLRASLGDDRVQPTKTLNLILMCRHCGSKIKRLERLRQWLIWH